VKRPRKKNQAKITAPTPGQLRQYMQDMAEQHQASWHTELMGSPPRWAYLIHLHLRMVELERIEQAVEELL
jgi:hypothetical protein